MRSDDLFLDISSQVTAHKPALRNLIFEQPADGIRASIHLPESTHGYPISAIQKAAASQTL